MRIITLIVCALTLSAPLAYAGKACCKTKKCNMQAHKNGKCAHKDKTCRTTCKRGADCGHDKVAPAPKTES